MTNNKKNKKNWYTKLLLGVVIVVVAVIALVLRAMMHEPMNGCLLVIICNTSVMEVTFEQVFMDDKIIWSSPDVIPTSRPSATPGHKRLNCVSLGPNFSTPKKSVELRVRTLNALKEPDEASCRLDLTSPSYCTFEAFYKEGLLICGSCAEF